MGWIDLKFREQEEAMRAQEESVGKSAQQQVSRLAIAAKAWNRLVDMLRSDIAQYNSHPKAKKRVEIRVVQNPNLIEVNWRGELRILLQISRKPNESIFMYSALSLGQNRSEQYGGQIEPQSDNEFTLVDRWKHSLQVDLAKLSEELLSPVLFP
jgi:hypothetical protein